MDINDNPPEFTVGTTYTIHREETYTQNAVSITAISATDRDTGNNAELTYSVTSDSSGLFYFAAGTVCVCYDKLYEYNTLSISGAQI